MKYAIASLSIIFILTAVFGFAVMCSDMSHGQMTGPCPLASFGNCAGNGLPMVAHHLTAYQSFLSINPFSSFGFSFALLFLFALLVWAISLLSSTLLIFNLLPVWPRWRAATCSVSLALYEKLRQLSLFENSPPQFA